MAAAWVQFCNVPLLGKPYFSTESLSLTEVAKELDRETLQRLKRECGGLQTLLRNSHQVFEGEGWREHPGCGSFKQVLASLFFSSVTASSQGASTF